MNIIGWLTSQKSPQIVVLLRPHPSNVQCLMLCIENIGTGTAYNVQLRTGNSGAAPSIQRASNLEDIGCFGPGQKIEQFLISLIDGLPEELKQPLQISVTYTDSLNRSYENEYTLDFGDFESFVQSDSIEGKAVSDLRRLLDVIQTGLSQIAENIERARLPQTPKSADSATLSREEEHSQPVQSEQDKPLRPELQTFVDLYNAGNNAELRQNYSPHFSISVSNEPERLQNPNAVPIFQTKKNGSLVAYAIDTKGDLYAVAPFFGCILQDKLYGTGAFSEIFECQGFHQGHRYHLKVIYPAFFLYEHANEKWTLHTKGKLELEEKEN